MTRTIRASWLRTETFTETFEVDDDVSAEDLDDVIADQIHGMDQDQLSTAFDDCTEFEISNTIEVTP